MLIRMPRPKLVSDEEVLDATLRVMLRVGPQQFTLTDVANEIGLSRAALIQRFSDKATLQLKTMERSTEEVRSYFRGAPKKAGLGPLWTMLEDLIAGMGSGDGFAGYLLIEWADTNDPALNRLSRERNELVRRAIAQRLPEDNRAENARLIQSVIQGATVMWLIEQQGTLTGYVTGQTRLVLSRLYPRHRF
jgi:AcrR family transcriptional regulator